MILRVKYTSETARAPECPRQGDVGIDLYADCPDEGDGLVVFPGRSVAVPTGIAVEIPSGFEGSLRGRSGHAFKHGLFAAQTGTIDPGYRGELKVLLHATTRPYFIKHHERIAQLVIHPVLVPRLITVVDELDETERGEGGFGSTGR